MVLLSLEWRVRAATPSGSLIVIGYLQIIGPDKAKDPRQEQVAKIARRLKVLAREIQVPVLRLAQLNRQTEAAKDNIPKLSARTRVGGHPHGQAIEAPTGKAWQTERLRLS